MEIFNLCDIHEEDGKSVMGRFIDGVAHKIGNIEDTSFRSDSWLDGGLLRYEKGWLAG